MIKTITQSALPQPEISWRRNKSPRVTMSSQNHTTKTKMANASARKLEKLNPPWKSIAILPCRFGSKPAPGHLRHGQLSIVDSPSAIRDSAEGSQNEPPIWRGSPLALQPHADRRGAGSP